MPERRTPCWSSTTWAKRPRIAVLQWLRLTSRVWCILACASLGGIGIVLARLRVGS
jgi:hypothetical protein